MNHIALVVGAGSGLSASLARTLAAEGFRVALAARNVSKLDRLASETGAFTHTCDASRPGEVHKLFDAVEHSLGAPDWVIFNASYRVRGPLVELDPGEVERTLAVSAYAGFLVGQRAARSMLARQDAARGAIFFTGASASVKGYANSAPFAMGKFALRGLAQSMARELGPKGVHVAHFVIDGGIAQHASDARAAERGADGLLLPDEIAKTYLHVYRQHRSAWSMEVELRPWAERF